jgi:hypothetical protein
LRRIFEPKRNEVTGGWRQLHNKELHNLYSSPSIIRMIKSRGWAGHAAHMEVESFSGKARRKETTRKTPAALPPGWMGSSAGVNKGH